MRKRVNFRRLGRTTSHKWALLRNMVTSLIKHERIVTTLPKAKELRHLADHMITLAKSGASTQLSAIREADKVIREKPILTKLFQVLGPRYEQRQGGYTRVLKLSKRRAGDNAEMAVMEYVDRPGELRAARPPTSVQQYIMAQYIKETLGIEPLIGEVEEIEKELQALNLKSVDGNQEENAEGVASTEHESATEIEESEEVVDEDQPDDEQTSEESPAEGSSDNENDKR